MLVSNVAPLIKEGDCQEHPPRDIRRLGDEGLAVIVQIQMHKNHQELELCEDIIAMELSRVPIKSYNTFSARDEHCIQTY